MQIERKAKLRLGVLLAFAVVTFCGAALIQGQDAALPRPETQDPATSLPQPSETPLPAIPPSQLIPDDVLPPPSGSPALSMPTIPMLDEALKQPPLSATAENQRRHREWRQLRNRVQNESEVKQALATADAARTDLKKRQLLRRYYELLYRKMTAIAPPEMKAYLNDRKNEALNALPQPKVRPETVVAGTPSTSPTPSPSPSASPMRLFEQGILPSAFPSPTPLR